MTVQTRQMISGNVENPMMAGMNSHFPPKCKEEKPSDVYLRIRSKKTPIKDSYADKSFKQFLSICFDPQIWGILLKEVHLVKVDR